jgi:integrase/recombinase XerD
MARKRICQQARPKEHLMSTKDILSQEEVQRIIVAATTLRDKAFISTLYESGCRIGELLSLTLRDVREYPHGFQITIRSMMGCRRLSLVASRSYLAAWLNVYPQSSDFNAPLWIVDNNHTALSYRRVCNILQQTAKCAKVHKTVNPHSLRRSRVAHLASYLADAQIMEYFGLTLGSDELKT